MKKLILIFTSLLISSVVISQEITPERITVESNSLAQEGTYQILATELEIKNANSITSETLREIELNRDVVSDVVLEIEDMIITIMSKEKVNKGMKWPKYKISVK